MVCWSFHSQQIFKDKCVLGFGKMDLRMVMTLVENGHFTTGPCD
jgi:hypothetical protein